MIFNKVTIVYRDGSKEEIACDRVDTDDSVIQLANGEESIVIVALSSIKKIEIYKENQ